MPERGGIEHVAMFEETAKTEKRTTVLDKEFTERLAHFPEEIQEEVGSLSSLKQKRLLKGHEGKKESAARQDERGIHPGFPEYLKEMMRAERERDRHMSGEWTEEEVAGLDPVSRELWTKNTLAVFFSRIDAQRTLRDTPASVKDVMQSLWSNRGKQEADVALLHGKRFSDIKIELGGLKEEKDRLAAEIQKITAHKGRNRQTQKRLDELNKQLDSFEETAFSNPGTNHLAALEREKNELEAEAKPQKSLAHFLAYLDASDFSVMINEAADSELLWQRHRDPKVMTPIYTEIEKWHQAHEKEKALMQPEDVSSAKREEKLLQHFWRLFESYERLNTDETADKERLVSTARELANVVRMLQ